MFCKYCGKENETEVCDECLKTHPEENSNKVENNESKTADTIEVEATRVENNTNTNTNTNNTTSSSTSVPKSKVAAGLLAIFLGWLGVHNFYLGYTSKAVGQLLLTLIGWIACGLGPFAAWVWGLIEGIMLLTGSIAVDADGNKLVE